MFAYATPGILGFGSGGDGFALRLDEALEFFFIQCEVLVWA